MIQILGFRIQDPTKCYHVRASPYFLEHGADVSVCVQVLCLAPTLELAIQIGEVASKMSQFDPDIKIRYLYN